MADRGHHFQPVGLDTPSARRRATRARRAAPLPPDDPWAAFDGERFERDTIAQILDHAAVRYAPVMEASMRPPRRGPEELRLLASLPGVGCPESSRDALMAFTIMPAEARDSEIKSWLAQYLPRGTPVPESRVTERFTARRRKAWGYADGGASESQEFYAALTDEGATLIRSFRNVIHGPAQVAVDILQMCAFALPIRKRLGDDVVFPDILALFATEHPGSARLKTRTISETDAQQLAKSIVMDLAWTLHLFVGSTMENRQPYLDHIERQLDSASRCPAALLEFELAAFLSSYGRSMGDANARMVSETQSYLRSALYNRKTPGLARFNVRQHFKVADFCDHCDEDESATRELRKCGRCHFARYCSKECQVAEWKDHNQSCRTISEGA
ncbi:hypothetical protein DFJ74DRAFT_712057 [Hyaloraphidium curvatum]|nr:hypothetical protein DFJ74DRAFT_712057 [Hyaloraphidium curvatum]